MAISELVDLTGTPTSDSTGTRSLPEGKVTIEYFGYLNLATDDGYYLRVTSGGYEKSETGAGKRASHNYRTKR